MLKGCFLSSKLIVIAYNGYKLKWPFAVGTHFHPIIRNRTEKVDTFNPKPRGQGKALSTKQCAYDHCAAPDASFRHPEKQHSARLLIRKVPQIRPATGLNWRHQLLPGYVFEKRSDL